MLLRKKGGAKSLLSVCSRSISEFPTLFNREGFSVPFSAAASHMCIVDVSTTFCALMMFSMPFFVSSLDTQRMRDDVVPELIIHYCRSHENETRHDLRGARDTMLGENRFSFFFSALKSSRRDVNDVGTCFNTL